MIIGMANERGLYGGPRCPERKVEGRRSWRCYLDAGHDGYCLSSGGGRRWEGRNYRPRRRAGASEDTNKDVSAYDKPVIYGQTELGAELTAHWERHPDARVTWTRDGRPIEGATGNSYRITKADLGREIGFEVSYSTRREN